MPRLPKLPPRLDLLKYFQSNHAAVKLLALLLVVLLEWGRTALYVGLPASLAVGLHKWVA
jgi:hypothetical protein